MLVWRPATYDPYVEECRSGRLQPGGISVYQAPDRLIVNMATHRPGIVQSFLREGPRRPVPEQGSPEWTRLVALAHTMPYDMQIQSEYKLLPERLREIRVPTLFLLGGASPPEMHRGTGALANGGARRRTH